MVGLIVGIRHTIFACTKKSPVIEGVAGTAVPSQGSGLIGQPTKNESGKTNVDEKKKQLDSRTSREIRVHIYFSECIKLEMPVQKL